MVVEVEYVFLDKVCSGSSTAPKYRKAFCSASKVVLYKSTNPRFNELTDPGRWSKDLPIQQIDCTMCSVVYVLTMLDSSYDLRDALGRHVSLTNKKE